MIELATTANWAQAAITYLVLCWRLHVPIVIYLIYYLVALIRFFFHYFLKMTYFVKINNFSKLPEVNLLKLVYESVLIPKFVYSLKTFYICVRSFNLGRRLIFSGFYCFILIKC